MLNHVGSLHRRTLRASHKQRLTQVSYRRTYPFAGVQQLTLASSKIMPSLVTKYCALNAVTQFVTKWPVLGELEEALKLSDYLLVRCMADNNDVVAKCLGDVCSFETNFTLNLARAQVLAAMAVRDKDAAKLTAAEQEIEKIRSQMLGWDCDAYTEAVIAKALQVIFKATGREAEDRTRLEEAVSKLLEQASTSQVSTHRR